MADDLATSLLLVGAAGVGMGVGLVVAAVAVRAVRRFLRNGDDPPK